jgi:hypothetical protein
MINEYDTDESYTDNQKQLLINCIKLINQGRYIQNKDKFSPSMSMTRSFYDFNTSSNVKQQPINKVIPNINV